MLIGQAELRLIPLDCCAMVIVDLVPCRGDTSPADTTIRIRELRIHVVFMGLRRGGEAQKLIGYLHLLLVDLLLSLLDSLFLEPMADVPHRQNDSRERKG